jgi:exopolysaccharide production protein ExoY
MAIAGLESAGEIAARERAAGGGQGFEFWLNFCLAALLLLFILPLMFVLAAAVFAEDRGPVIFSHRRIGKAGKPFYCLKFRTMAVDAESRLQELLASDAEARKEWARDHKLKTDPRITRIGSFLRKSSLDELPQLVNVLFGEMNLVGPRPVVQAEIAKYGRRFQHYCSVQPGITGLWQIGGRNDVSYRRRVAMDVLYARSKTVGLDFKILLLTVPVVLMRRGSY